MRRQADELRDIFSKGKKLEQIGEILHEAWELKKKMASGISKPEIDELYEKSLQAGAIGGKILGAGGGGFLLVFCPLSRKDQVRNALRDLKETPFEFEPQGSKIIYVEE